MSHGLFLYALYSREACIAFEPVQAQIINQISCYRARIGNPAACAAGDESAQRDSVEVAVQGHFSKSRFAFTLISAPLYFPPKAMQLLPIPWNRYES